MAKRSEPLLNARHRHRARLRNRRHAGVRAPGQKFRHGVRILEFFAANIGDPHTRRAYSRARLVAGGGDQGRDRKRPRAQGGTIIPRPTPTPMIRRRAAAAGIATKVGNHTFRTTGITAARSKTPPPWQTTPRPASRLSALTVLALCERLVREWL
jgi:hypothetical protein